MSGPRAPFPHCDSLVLHVPGQCAACDKYPSAQMARLRADVLFTGERPRPGYLPCPSTLRRTVDTIEAWPGNRPTPRGPVQVYAAPTPDELERKSWLRRLLATTRWA